MRQGNLPGAADQYIQATELSPPGSALSYYMAGYCYEHLGELERANDLYLSSLQIDPEGISPVQGLLRTAKRTGKRALLQWVVEKAEHLVTSGHIAQQELMF
jgi:tetratricopeptide (TPR) repeat protein